MNIGLETQDIINFILIAHAIYTQWLTSKILRLIGEALKAMKKNCNSTTL